MAKWSFLWLKIEKPTNVPKSKTCNENVKTKSSNKLIVTENATTVNSGKAPIVRGKARGGGAAKKGLGYNVSPN